MNLPHSPRSGSALLLSLIAAAGLSMTSLSAQSVATAPVGAVTKTIPAGLSALGISLVNPNLAVATASANTATSVTLSDISNVGTLLTAGTPYYIEAISGPMEGDRFDVNTDATISAGNSTVVISTAPGNYNTVALAAGDAVNSSFALRKHVTIAQIGSSFASTVANNNVNSADQIRLFNQTTSSFTNYYLRSTPAGEWRLQGAGSGSSNNLVVPPGTGVMISKRTASTTSTFVGSVRTNDFAMLMPVGLSFQAPAYPISFSPSSLGGTAANGWTANNNINLADQLRVFNEGTGQFNSYYIRTTPLDEWRPQGGGTGTGVTTSVLFPYDSAFLVARKAADPEYILVSPVNL